MANTNITDVFPQNFTVVQNLTTPASEKAVPNTTPKPWLIPLVVSLCIAGVIGIFILILIYICCGSKSKNDTTDRTSSKSQVGPVDQINKPTFDLRNPFTVKKEPTKEGSEPDKLFADDTKLNPSESQINTLNRKGFVGPGGVYLGPKNANARPPHVVGRLPPIYEEPLRRPKMPKVPIVSVPLSERRPLPPLQLKY